MFLSCCIIFIIYVNIPFVKKKSYNISLFGFYFSWKLFLQNIWFLSFKFVLLNSLNQHSKNNSDFLYRILLFFITIYDLFSEPFRTQLEIAVTCKVCMPLRSRGLVSGPCNHIFHSAIFIYLFFLENFTQQSIFILSSIECWSLLLI